jgi:putative aldouronate transport system substrate-binding protein
MQRFLALLLAVLLFTVLAYGCRTEDAPDTPSPSPAKESTPPVEDVEETPGEETAVSYPLADEPVTLTCYWPFDFSYTDIVDYADEQYFREAARITNVYMDFHHPSSANAKEAFNLMITSQEYDDMIKGFYSNYTAGVDHAIENGIIAPLQDMGEYLPNYFAIINSNNEIKKLCYSDQGNLWGINHIVHRPQDAWAGPTIRYDMLVEMGYGEDYADKIVTVDDWEEVLIKLKETFPSLKDGPFLLSNQGGTSSWGTLTGAYGIGAYNAFLNRNGTVVFSPLLPEYKDYLMKMRDWFEKGLIYKDFAGLAMAVLGPVDLVANDKIAVFDAVYSWYDVDYSQPATDENFELRGLPLPKLNRGDTLHIRQNNQWARSMNSLCISGTCSNLELACRFWDFAFTEEGIILANWGVENVTFVYDENNQPKYTDLVLDFPLGISNAMTKYVLFNAPGVCYWDREQQELSETCIEATRIWTESALDDWVYPVDATLTEAEGAEYSMIFNDVQTYVNEFSMKLITGAESFDKYDSFIEEIKSMEIEEAIRLKQAALDRFEGRLSKIGN